MSRRLAVGSPKVRGAARRFAQLRDWGPRMGSLDLHDELASARERGERYWNWKIPVHAGLVEPPARLRAQRDAVQAVIDAAAGLRTARDAALATTGPIGQDGFNRVVALVSVPDLFSSEVCLYLERDYYDSHLATSLDDDPLRLPGRSLAAEWNLTLPDGFGERGVLVEYEGESPEDSYRCEHWYFGEV